MIIDLVLGKITSVDPIAAGVLHTGRRDIGHVAIGVAPKKISQTSYQRDCDNKKSDRQS